MAVLSGARAEPYSREAQRHVECGEWLMAISSFRRALEEAPDRAACHYNLGLCLMQAWASLHDSLQLGALNAEAGGQLVEELQRQGGAEVVLEAIEHYRNALLLEMNYPEAWCVFAEAIWLLVQSATLEGRSGEFDEHNEKIAAGAAMASVLLLEKKRGPLRETAVEVLIEIAMRRGYTSDENLGRFQNAVDLARFQVDAAKWLFALIPPVLGMERDEFFHRFKKARRQTRSA